MIKTLKYWFTFKEAPPEIKKKIKGMAAAFGYKSNRKDGLGQAVVSEMFLLHCKAASVSHLSIYSVVDRG